MAAEDELKIPPHSIDSEQSVLGGLMLQNEAWETVSDIIDSTDFYRAAHSKIYSAIQNLSLEDNPFDKPLSFSINKKISEPNTFFDLIIYTLHNRN